MQALRLILSSSILLACAILVGCSDAPNTVNLDYHQRLQTQLELADLTPDELKIFDNIFKIY